MSDLDLPYCHGNLHSGHQKWVESVNYSPPGPSQEPAELKTAAFESIVLSISPS
ncbi:uncharacterized protein METZ01_LOCUS137717 [marine metagenome]|uniref:Uncharacterized protein n=1 Tax=marine metagenome TaxID=408172 RepID=A0A381Z7V5_9ZZZZ